MSNKPTTPASDVKTLVRLRPDVLAELEKKFPMLVQRDTTDTQVATMLGQQMVLRALREGYTVNV